MDVEKESTQRKDEKCLVGGALVPPLAKAHKAVYV